MSLPSLPFDPALPVRPTRRQLGLIGLACGLGAVALPASAQLFGRTAGLAPLLLAADGAAPPVRAFEIAGRTLLARKVVLASFTVDVVFEHLRQVPAAGVAVGIPAAATQFADMQLNGLDDTALQGATDRIFAAWQQAGRAAGIDMVSIEDMQRSPAWAAVRAAGRPSGSDIMGRGIRARAYAPQGLVVNGIGQVPPEAGLPQPSGNVTDAVGNVQSQVRELKALALAAQSGEPLERLARELGAQLMSVRLVLASTELVDELRGHPDLLSTRDGRTRVGLHLDARSSQVVISRADNDDASTLTLRLPFLLPGASFSGIDSAAPGEVNVTRAAAQALLRWRGVTQTTRHDIQADSAAFTQVAAGALAALAPAVFSAFKRA